jgi:ComF family protein
MGIYARIKAKFTLKQSCVLCKNLGRFCVCSECENKFSTLYKRCLSCATKLPDNTNHSLSFCGACLSHAPCFSRAYALYDYKKCDDLIKLFKFQHQLCVGRYFAYKLYNSYLEITRLNGEYDAIIPLPLSRKRAKNRGYNQSIELLSVIKKYTNVKIDTQSVKRIKHTKPLSQLKIRERQIEIKGAFSVENLSYQKVLLIDDVMSSTSSMNELAKTLLKAGVVECDVLVVART